jgi:hypothetical protein
MDIDDQVPESQKDSLKEWKASWPLLTLADCLLRYDKEANTIADNGILSYTDILMVIVRGPLSISPYSSFIHSCLYPSPIPYCNN